MRNKLGRDEHHMKKSMGEHKEIARLLRKNEVDAAIDMVLKHIVRKEGSYWQTLEQDLSASDPRTAR
ncbi:hypothetical protein FNB15_07475 [Ferrovibrio terrae]|uniref:FCD domain-containing protein n=1 Tax=Ferrovibrio terrae TaxID=2594003 RepID=A0A516H021_9PROT|nr:hypothetical protein [Ferrovibrio terrae]QDO97124.1 hypothetical protein FNB15_07475 [Ferrovibrio terrae]